MSTRCASLSESHHMLYIQADMQQSTETQVRVTLQHSASVYSSPSSSAKHMHSW